MLWFHPLLAAITTILAFYVFGLGLVRLFANHFGGTGKFQWKQHVLLGKVVALFWTLSFAGGATMVWLNWPDHFLKGAHTKGGVYLLVLLALSLGSGWFMDRRPKKRRFLPLAHAAISVCLLALALVQAWTGWGIVQNALLK